jgi:hypothetical protein
MFWSVVLDGGSQGHQSRSTNFFANLFENDAGHTLSHTRLRVTAFGVDVKRNEFARRRSASSAVSRVTPECIRINGPVLGRRKEYLSCHDVRTFVQPEISYAQLVLLASDPNPESQCREQFWLCKLHFVQDFHYLLNNAEILSVVSLF